MKKVTHQNRLLLQPDGQLLDSPKGRLFVDSMTGVFTDLSGVRILRCGVDTVRQLYNGKLRPEVMTSGRNLPLYNCRTVSTPHRRMRTPDRSVN